MALREGRVVVLAALITIFTTMPLFVLGALGPSLEQQGIIPAQLGIAVAAFTGAQAIAAVALAKVANRAAVSTMLKWSLAIAALSLAAISTVQFGWYLLVAAAAIGGVGAAAAQPASSDFIVQRISPSAYGRTFGILQASKPMTVLLLGLAVGVLTSLHANLLVLLVTAAGLCLVLILFVPRAESRIAREATSSHPPLLRLPVIMLSLCAALSLGVGTTMVSFLPLSAAAAGHSPGEIALLLAVGSGLALVVRVGVGVLADRKRQHPMVLAAVLLGIGAVGLVLLGADGRDAEFFLGGLLAFAGGWGATGLLYLSGAAVGIGAPSQVTGIMITGGGLGSTVIPIFFGTAATAVGYPTAWFALAVIGALAVVAAAMAVACHPDSDWGVRLRGK